MCVCVSVRLCHMSEGACGSEKSRATDNCELPCCAVGNQSLVFCKNIKYS